MTAEPKRIDPDDAEHPVGLIAGGGRLPFMVAEGVCRAGRRLAVVGFRGSVDEGLDRVADRFSLAGVTRWSTIIRLLRRWSVRRAVMVGRVAKDTMYTPAMVAHLMPDWRTLKLWYGKLARDRRDQEVLNTVAEELASEGIELISSVAYCTEHLAVEGTMTTVRPRGSAMGDVRFGWRIARRSAELDIGQALAVKDADIIAVEAMEGTDRMIQRTGKLCRSGGWTLIKVARPNQDMRFDVPTVGPDTLRRVKACGGACVVVEAGCTIIIDKPQTLALADELGIPVVGMKA
ncbi:MAG: LpxI family protein [Planctomycetota bacterium]